MVFLPALLLAAVIGAVIMYLFISGRLNRMRDQCTHLSTTLE